MTRYLLLLALVGLCWLIYACAKEAPKKPPLLLPEGKDFLSLAMPIMLSPHDTNQINLEDFLLEVAGIRSVSMESGFSCTLSPDKKTLSVVPQKNAPLCGVLKIHTESVVYSLLFKMKGAPQKMGKGAPPKLYTLQTGNGKISFAVENAPTQLFVLWDNYQIPDTAISVDGHTYTVEIPSNAKWKERSFIRVLAGNAHGISNDLLIPLEKNITVKETALLKRTDKERQIMYFALVDRFANGNQMTDEPVKDARVHDMANYMGGDLEGILQKIRDGYFKDLHINSLWISPIAQNPKEAFQESEPPHYFYSGYHGYWPIHSTQIDYRFGSAEVFKQLVEEAHSQDLAVLLDVVANHVHQDHPLYKAHPDWATPLRLPDGRMNLRLWDEHRLTTWFDAFLPTIDYQNPKALEEMANSTLFWLKEYKLDGYRHDATKHIPEVFWRTLNRKIRAQVVYFQNRPVFQIGETFGSRELMSSYLGSGMLDAQFDFNLYFDARTAFASDSTSFLPLKDSLEQSFHCFGWHSTMGNITGNHDMPRFISYASGALSFDEDAKMAGWMRKATVKDPVGYARLSALTAFMMTIPGIPVISYGDEIGLPGAGDPDNRHPMKFEGLNGYEQQTRATASKLAGLRAGSMALTYGDFDWLHAGDFTMAYSRTYFEELAVVAFNKSMQPVTFSFNIPPRFDAAQLKAHFGGKISVQGQTVSITLEGNRFEVLGNW